jgi:hypothetical protein
VSKIKKFQEEGDANKCTVCAKTVYLAEKMILEDKSGKKLLHKACFKCTTCTISLNLENYGIAEAKYYCKTHLKEVQKVVPTATVVPLGPGNTVLLLIVCSQFRSCPNKGRKFSKGSNS